MVRIRLRRVGLKKQPSYRIVVADGRSPRDGRFIEAIGHYNPRTIPITNVVDEARVLYWLSQGAQPSVPVKKILVRTGTWTRYERLRSGEALEALVAEAQAALAEAAPVSPKTRYPAPEPGKSKQKAQAEAAVAEAVEQAESKVAEPEAEAAVEAEASEEAAE